MTDSFTLIELATAALAALALVVAALLHGWREWLALKRLERLGGAAGRSRGEMAELRARVRKLEAIANGIEL